MITWSDMQLPPINLFNFPRQDCDYMRNIKADNRAKSLQLNPRKPATKAQRPAQIEPARGETHNYEYQRALRCKGFGGGR